MGLWNSHTSLGNILGSLIAGAFVTDNWGLSFTVPGLIIAGIGFLTFFFLVPKPSEADLPESDSSGGEQADSEERHETQALLENKEEEEGESPGVPPVDVNREETAIGFFGALRIPGVIEFSLCLFFSKLVSYTFLYWLPNYIHTESHVDAEESAVLSTIFDLGGIIGGTIAGIASDKTNRPATTCLVMLVMAIPSMFVYEKTVKKWCPITAHDGVPVHDSCFTWNIVLTLVTGTLVNGPYALITTAVSAELGNILPFSGLSIIIVNISLFRPTSLPAGQQQGPGHSYRHH